MRVFVSSTVYDLIDARAEIENLLRSMHFMPVMSDVVSSHFTVPTDTHSIETCLVNLRSCEAVILVLSERYGPTLEAFGRPGESATHAEYREAIKHNIPVHFYIRDRLESEYGVWKKNRRPSSENLRFSWVKSNDFGLFALIDERRMSEEGKNKQNWVTTFKDSLQLKECIRRDFAAKSARIELKHLLAENKMPIFDVTIEVVPSRPDFNQIYVRAILTNVGTVPAYNVQYFWDDQTEKDVACPVRAPGSTLLYSWALREGAKLTARCSLTYSTPAGYSVSDCFEVDVHNENGVVSTKGEHISRRYRIGNTVNLEIEI